MILSDHERKQALRAGLLGHHTAHAEQYVKSAVFRQKIDIFIDMLPAVVDGLSREAFDQEQRFKVETLKEQMMTRPMVIPNTHIKGTPWTG